MDYCATNRAILSNIMCLNLSTAPPENPLKEARERLGLSQDELAILAALPELRAVVKAHIAGLEAGVFARADLAMTWTYIKRVFERARFNVLDLEQAYIQWGKDVDKSIADETLYIVGKGWATPGLK